MNTQDLLSRVINRYQHGSIIFSRFSEKSSQRIDLFDLKEALLIDEDFFRNILRNNQVLFDFSPNHCKRIFDSFKNLSEIQEEHSKFYEEFSKWWSTKRKDNPTKNSFFKWVLNIKWPSVYKRLKTLILMAQAHRAETGINILNLGFINLIGKISYFDQKVPIKSPLFFIKLEATRDSIGKFQIKLELASKHLDIQLNYILLEFFAFANNMQNLDYKALDDYCVKLNQIFNNDLLLSEKQNKLIQAIEELNNSVFKRLFNIELANFKASASFDFFNFDKFYFADVKRISLLEEEAFNPNTLEIHPNLIIGLYRMDGEGIIHDLKELSSKVDDNFFDDLLSVPSDKIAIEKEEDFNFNEKDILQISPLDFTQKKAIFIAANKSIIIKGPPGTGKSQTITNLLINNLWKNKSTVFSTEKKVASDVVYDKLSAKYKKFILKIDDIFSNKSIILSQLKDNVEFFTKKAPTTLTPEVIEEKLSDVNQQLDDIFSKVDEYKKFTASDEFSNYIEILKQTTTKFDSALENELLNHPFIDKEKLHHPENIDLIFANIRFAIRAINFVNDFEYKEFFLTLALDDKVLNFDWSKAEDSWKTFLYYLNKDKLLSHVSFFKALNIKNQTNFSDFDLKKFVNYLTSLTKLTNREKDLLLEYYKLHNLDAISIFKKINLVVNRDEELKQLIYRIFIVNFEDLYFDKLLVKDLKWCEKIKILIDEKIKLTTDVIPYFLREERRKLIVKKAKNLSYKRLFNECIKVIEERKTRLNVRSFFLKYNEIILDICPILILNLSVIPFLFPVEKNLISYIVFDEASQIFFENAIASIYRAEKYIIVGDEQQLQPTGFFLKNVFSLYYDDEEDDEDNSLENDSLLTYFSCLDKILLKYHYRSSYPELISFSNKHFYKNELVFAPYLELNTDNLPIANNKGAKLPVLLCQVKGEYIDRVNDNVSQKGLEVLKAILENNKNKNTVGVIVFNLEQSKKFAKALQDQSWSFKLVNEKQDEHKLFIKNLEDIQGDERDIIILLIAFAKNKDGRLIRNFGPISRTNGDKRINVAITRAKKQLIVVKSLNSNEIIDQNTSLEGSNGNFIFGKYLEYVESLSNNTLSSRGKERQQFLEYHKNLIEDELGITDFEKAVAKELANVIPSKFDLKVGTWVGEGTRFDIVIFNKTTGAFALVIECDGDKITSPLSPKERDWYRINFFLEHQWKFYWISAIDWWTPGKKELIIDQINQHLKNY